MLSIRLKERSILPGFGLGMGYTLLYLSLIVLIPLAATFFRTSQSTWEEFWQTVTDPRVVASYKLTFGASLIAAIINAMFGLLAAWVLERYDFPLKRILDGLIDLPFALPTAVAGIALTSIYASNGWIGATLQWWPWLRWEGFVPGDWWPLTVTWHRLAVPWITWQGFSDGVWPFGIEWYNKLVYTPIGVTIALTFTGMPFVVRTVQPVLAEMSKEIEEAASSLGATPFQTFRRVIFPEIFPALLTGFALSFARAVGEYGSVVFIAANLPMKTEITPLLIITKLEQYDYNGATALAVVMLVVSFVMLLTINVLQRWASRQGSA